MKKWKWIASVLLIIWIVATVVYAVEDYNHNLSYYGNASYLDSVQDGLEESTSWALVIAIPVVFILLIKHLVQSIIESKKTNTNFFQKIKEQKKLKIVLIGVVILVVFLIWAGIEFANMNLAG